MDRTCSVCRQTKPQEAFAKRSDRPRGVQSRCKECQRSQRCADCGKSVTRYATYCINCRFKGGRNPIAGTVRPDSVRRAVSDAQRGVSEPVRTIRKPKNGHSGRGQANRLFTKPDACERCGETKRLDWHHINDDATDNRRENLSALCRRCHQSVDGRHEFLASGRQWRGETQRGHAAGS